MMRRQEALRFMGGMWVFPGGRVDPPDCGPAAAALVAAESAAHAPVMCAPDGTPLGPELVLGLRVAACRETYEEAGVLLVRRRDGRPPAGAELHALASAQHGVTHAPVGFLDLVASGGLLLDVDRLVHWSHWITPSHEPRRFDTHFFVAALPEGQRTRDVSTETDHVEWLAPAEVLSREAAGEIRLLPPTRVTLAGIAACADIPAVFAAAAERDSGTPVKPRIEALPDGRLRLVTD